MPNDTRTALLGGSYMVAMDEDWGIGPTVYGAAKGNFGGLFTVGFTAQHRKRLGSSTYLATSLYAGAGGGVSMPDVRFGGGLMLRPEISLRNEWGNWSGGLSLSHVRFPSGNIRGTSIGFVLGYADGFRSFSPSSAGKKASSYRRTGMGFDEIGLNVGSYRPRHSALGRDGSPLGRQIGQVGAALRQYVSDGAWWGLEAAGASSGGADGYMEVLGMLGEDYELVAGLPRLGWQAGVGLGGGGNLNTGSGWLVKAGPTLRWKTPWGPSLRLEAGFVGRPAGSFNANFLRLSASLPLDRLSDVYASSGDAEGRIANQVVGASLQHLRRVRFKDGREESVGLLGMRITRDLGPHVYGMAQAGSAAFGSAGAYSYGLLGLGLQTQPSAGMPVSVGLEMGLGAGGGGGIAVSGGAIAQTEAWAEWQWERVRLHAGLGQWRSLRGQTQSSPSFNLSVGYAFGALSR
ncbi:hypothetical protein [Roseateles aquae]|nr:hypothetical protein [Paucibacter sp. APW11]